MVDTFRSCFAVLGNGLTKDGRLPPHVARRLDNVADIYQNSNGDKPLLAVVGKRSFWYRKKNKKHPDTTEAGGMQKYLIKKGVPEESILVENRSEDTIGNAFFLKNALEPTGIKDLTIVCADYAQVRTQYIFSKVFGNEYKLRFLATAGPYEGMELELEKLKQGELLEEQKPIVEDFLEHPRSLGSFYDDPYYLEQLLGEEPVDEVARAALGIMPETVLPMATRR